MANGYWTSHGQLTESELAAVQLAVANGIATYAAGEIEKLAGIPNIAPLLTLAEVNAYPRSFTIARSAGPTGPVVCAAATYVKGAGYVVTNPSGTIMKIDQATGIAHGMGAASDGKYLWIRTSAGIPTGFYEITDRGSVADEINVDVGAESGSIGTTVIEAISLVNTAFPAVVIPVPAGILGPNGTLQIGPIIAEFTGSTNWKYILTYANTAADGTGGTQMGGAAQTNTASHVGFNTPPAQLVNTASESIQRSFGPAEFQASTAPGSHTIDTTAAFNVAIQAKLSAVDESINIVAWRADIVPGL